MDGRTSTGTSSRSTANLSLERLYRKRAIDRGNQRILRQRNKARLAELEQEVKSLTEKLEQVEAEKALQAAKTQNSSASIDSIIGSLRSLQLSLSQLQQPTPPPLPPLLASTAAIPSPPASSALPGHSYLDASGSGVVRAIPIAEDSSTHSSPESTLATTAEAAMQQHQQQSYAAIGGERMPPAIPGLDNLELWGTGASVTVLVDDYAPFSNHDFSLNLDFLTRNVPLVQTELYSNDAPTSSDPCITSPSAAARCKHVDFEAPSPSPTAVGDSLRKNPHTDTGAVYLARLEANKLRDATPIWSITPPYVPPTSSVDEMLISLVHKRREEQKRRQNNTARSQSGSVTSHGADGDEFAHSNFPSVSSLLNPVLYELDNPVASTIARHVASTVMVYTTPEKAALLYMMCMLIRWYISPTKEHYDSIPEFFRPTGAQLVIPHPFWIDTIGWPRARDRLIRHLDFTKYRSFASIIVKSFSIGWPRPGWEGILESTPEKGYVMTRAFIQHVREASNWTVGPELIEAFPYLDGSINVRGRPMVST